eukprot:15461179-Alexandrium_andersonii.AAC.1
MAMSVKRRIVSYRSAELENVAGKLSGLAKPSRSSGERGLWSALGNRRKLRQDSHQDSEDQFGSHRSKPF